MSPTKRLRHWKQRFDKDAEFVWNKAVLWQGKPVEIGGKIPTSLAVDRNRLRRFWEARVIQLLDFSAPDVLTGSTPEKDIDTSNGDNSGDDSSIDFGALVAKVGNRKWTAEGTDEIFTSKAKAVEHLENVAKLTADLEAEAEAEAMDKLQDEAEAENVAFDAASESDFLDDLEDEASSDTDEAETEAETTPEE